MRRKGDKIPAAIETELPNQQATATDAQAEAERNGIVEKCVNCQYYDRRNARPTDAA